jgi:hypothetical protein
VQIVDDDVRTDGNGQEKEAPGTQETAGEPHSFEIGVGVQWIAVPTNRGGLVDVRAWKQHTIYIYNAICSM